MVIHMQNHDAQRWNKRYRTETTYQTKSPRWLLKEYLALLPESGIALDIAMGLGHDSCLLAEHGLTVYGVDIAFHALRQAKKRCPNLRVFAADMEHNPLPSIIPDLILNFYYYQPSLIPELIQILKPGGFFFFETFTSPMINIKPQLNPEHLVEPDFIMKMIGNLDMIYTYNGFKEDTPDKQRYVFQFIGQKRR